MTVHEVFFGQCKSATLRTEEVGFTCTFVWFLCAMLSYYEPFFSDTWTVLLFMLLLCIGLVGAALLWEKQPHLADRAVLYTAVLGAVCTGLIPFLPLFAGKIVFWLSALFMAFLLCRRLYGVLITARENIRFRAYIFAISIALVAHYIWMQIPLPFTIKFPALSVMALLGLYGAGARLPEHLPKALPKFAGFNSPARLLRIAVIFVLLVLVNLLDTLIHAHVLTDSLNNNNLLSFAIWAIVPLSYMFFAFFSDFKREQTGFIIGMALIFAGCFAALAPGGNILTAPLLLAGGFGGSVTEFYFLTMPLLFFNFSKKPQLVAVSGLVIHTLLSSALSWTQHIWLPRALLQQFDRSVIIFGAVCVMALLPLALSAWKQYKDASLISALLGLRKQTENRESTPIPDMQAYENMDWIRSFDFLESEHRIASLLCEGLSRAEISEKLGMSAAQLSINLRRMQKKLGMRASVGQSPYALKAAKRYGLTARETEVFNELILGRSNAEISANLYIEESTVKTHVNKIMKKTGMNNRAELIAGMRTEQNASCSADAPPSRIHEQ